MDEAILKKYMRIRDEGVHPEQIYSSLRDAQTANSNINAYKVMKALYGDNRERFERILNDAKEHFFSKVTEDYVQYRDAGSSPERVFLNLSKDPRLVSSFEQIQVLALLFNITIVEARDASHRANELEER
ncbi:hypothetical protein HC928_20485 [bacterium]|nr:hypothetical protein [bacterium]